MKQLTRPLDRLGRRRNRDMSGAATAELEVLVARRRAQPPPAGSVRPTIRAAVAEDRLALEELALRCSAETLTRRFHSPAGHLPVTRVAELLEGPGASQTLVAEAGGALVAVGSLHRSRSGEGEIAVLVEDAWQHTGLGHRMTGHLLRAAREDRIDVVVADVMREPRYLVERLARLTADTTVEFYGPVATIRVPVASVGVARAGSGPTIRA